MDFIIGLIFGMGKGRKSTCLSERSEETFNTLFVVSNFWKPPESISIFKIYLTTIEYMKPSRSFAARYNATHLVYYEHFKYILDAIAREKQIKGWKRFKKNRLIESINSEWKFLEDELER